jgi:HEPN domain-containing protein
MDKRHELIQEWIHKADHDLGMAKLALEHQIEYADSICFHSQQAVEKYLKAYLVHLNLIFKKTHSLSYLLDLINEVDKVSDKMYARAEIL